MASVSDWRIAANLQPKVADYDYDLDTALSAVVGLRATVPPEAFTADILGTERSGNGVLIRESGLVVTIGYLITEAEQVWLTLNDGRTVPGHVMAYDQESGFGLVQALSRLDFPCLTIGDSSLAQVGEQVVVGGAGGRSRSVAARIVGKQEFAGNWEYVIDDAIFTTPAHPNWGGTALLNSHGELIGIGSLQLEQSKERGRTENLNMIVPIDLLKPILDDLTHFGQRNRPARPWLGCYAAEVEDKVVIVGLSDDGPAERANLHSGDIVLDVAGHPVDSLAQFFRRVWALGPAGVEVPLTLYREGRTLQRTVTSGDRNKLLWRPKLH